MGPAVKLHPYWRLNIPIRPRRWTDYDRLNNTIEALKEGREIVKDTGIQGLTDTFGVLITILDIQSTASNRKELILSLCDEMQELITIIRGATDAVTGELSAYPLNSPERKLLRDSISSSITLTERVQRLHSELREACGIAAESSRQTSVSLWRSRDDTGMLMERIARARQRFNGQVTVEALITRAITNTKELLASQKAEDGLHVVALPRAEGADYRSVLNAEKGRFLAGTRKELIITLNAWVEGRTPQFQGKGVFFLTAAAGSGKSAIAVEFCRRNEMLNRLGASFFFARGNQVLESTDKFFPTLAYQLAHSQPFLRPHIDAAARRYRDPAEYGLLRRMRHAFEELIQKPLAALPETHPPIVVVIDGLDECAIDAFDSIPYLLRLLISCTMRPSSPLRILVTSRPDPLYIVETIGSPEFSDVVHISSLDNFNPNDVSNDIRAFVQDSLGRYSKGKAWIESNPEVVPALTEQASGSFLYARIAIRWLLEGPSSLESRFEILRKLAHTGELVTLDRLYLLVLESAFPKEEMVPRRLRRVLELLVVLQGPHGISPRTLEALTGIPSGDSVSVLNKLRSVLLFDSNNPDSTFYLTHSTFRDFLMNLPSSGPESVYRLERSEEEIHADLATHCMRVLCCCAKDLLPVRRVDVDLLVHVLSHTPPDTHDILHVHYALDHLSYHEDRSGAHLSGNTEWEVEWTDLEQGSPSVFTIMTHWLELSAPSPLVTILEELLISHPPSARESHVKKVAQDSLQQFMDLVYRSGLGVASQESFDAFITELLYCLSGIILSAEGNMQIPRESGSGEESMFHKAFADLTREHTHRIENQLREIARGVDTVLQIDTLHQFLDSLRLARAYVKTMIYAYKQYKIADRNGNTPTEQVVRQWFNTSHDDSK